MLLSKRPEMFLPEKWPSYFTKAKGCKVWDMDGEEYIDMSIMGIGANILGYADDDVDKQVIGEMIKGNKMQVIGFSSRGTKTTDIYSLVGFNSAYTYISNLCNVKN